MSIKNYFKKNAAAITLGFMSMNASSTVTAEAINAYREEQIRNAKEAKKEVNYKSQVVTA